MKALKVVMITCAAMAIAACSARNDKQFYSIDEALHSESGKKVLNPNIKLYFGKPAPGKVISPGLVSNKKTNAFNKSDKEACQWAFLSAVKRFQDTAASQGATKVGNLVSYYKKNEFRSTTQYECHAGHLMGGVALKGDIVK
ncbi:excinuclease ABC subunit A [Bisgaard Taxon 10/6]|uniref:excinuclease ABC subunit A n=1 Tax=Exercitatus varius TaxID=67857 RepID=UPI00294B10B2|nr:excinuclease ABC subunit A [Exercitatus varius]MDG2961315.1 excinuclease ABC subunit A [Exercitatus varius]